MTRRGGERRIAWRGRSRRGSWDGTTLDWLGEALDVGVAMGASVDRYRAVVEAMRASEPTTASAPFGEQQDGELRVVDPALPEFASRRCEDMDERGSSVRRASRVVFAEAL